MGITMGGARNTWQHVARLSVLGLWSLCCSCCSALTTGQLHLINQLSRVQAASIVAGVVVDVLSGCVGLRGRKTVSLSTVYTLNLHDSSIR